MIPKCIIVDETGPENGADIKSKCILVRKENLDTLLEGRIVLIELTSELS
jgi:hypothetical protein